MTFDEILTLFAIFFHVAVFVVVGDYLIDKYHLTDRLYSWLRKRRGGKEND